MKKIFLFLLLFFLFGFSPRAFATPSLTSFLVNGVQYFTLEIAGAVYEIGTDDEIMRADLENMPDGSYLSSASACAEECIEPVEFWLTIQTIKNQRYYAVSPRPGFEEFFVEPTSIVINIKAGKEVGKPKKK